MKRPREASAGLGGLLCGPPEVVLARLRGEDPLRLRARVARRLAERALLLDLERALLRVQAAVALAGAAACGVEEPEAWLEARVDEALGQLLAEERAGPASPALVRLCAPLGLDGERLASACARFNHLPAEVRRAFFALVLEGASPDALARAQALPLGELGRRARAGLEPFRGLVRAREAPSRVAERRA